MSSRIDEIINEYGIYNTSDIINNFKEYFGFTFRELENKFKNMEKNVVSKNDVIEYCRVKFLHEKVVSDRIKDYECFYKMLAIYRDKGILILELFSCLSSAYFADKYKHLDNLLSELNIYRNKCFICGEALIRIMRPLKRLILEYDKIMNTINNMSTYDRKNYDEFALGLGEELYPSKSIIKNGNDPTSISIKKDKTYCLTKR